jgi:homocysteine S-methyltransferase
VFLTDSGLETDLIGNHGIDLPEFAAFPLVEDAAGRAALRRYYAEHLAVAVAAGRGIVLEAGTWRASRRWGSRLGYDAAGLRRANRRAVDVVAEVGARAAVPVVVSAAIGPETDAPGRRAPVARTKRRPITASNWRPSPPPRSTWCTP